jgi:hypothetical protein
MTTSADTGALPRSDDPEHTPHAPLPNTMCQHCQDRLGGSVPEQSIYVLGQLDVRMPTIGIEREFQQRERVVISGASHSSVTRWERLTEVLRANPHLGRSVCFALSVGGMPAYVVTPTTRDVLTGFLDAIEKRATEGAWTLIIGRRGPLASPATCGGLVAPIVACDQVYAFSIKELLANLSQAIEPAIKSKKLDRDRLVALGGELFDRIATSVDNMGALDSHRALNYLLVQHPGLFLAYAERHATCVLDSIETGVADSPGLRRIVTVILTFLDRTTGVPERLFTRVDTTEQWPFLADTSHAGAPILGLRPFIGQGPSGSLVL